MYHQSRFLARHGNLTMNQDMIRLSNLQKRLHTKLKMAGVGQDILALTNEIALLTDKLLADRDGRS